MPQCGLPISHDWLENGEEMRNSLAGVYALQTAINWAYIVIYRLSPNKRECPGCIYTERSLRQQSIQKGLHYHDAPQDEAQGVSAVDADLGEGATLRVAPGYADALVLYARKPSGGTTASICSWLGTK
jgi:hypothetical protein